MCSCLPHTCGSSCGGSGASVCGTLVTWCLGPSLGHVGGQLVACPDGAGMGDLYGHLTHQVITETQPGPPPALPKHGEGMGARHAAQPYGDQVRRSWW